MSKFNKVTPEFVEKLRSILGEKGVTTDPKKLLTFQTDEEGNSYWFRTPEVVVFPGNDGTSSGHVKLANEHPFLLRRRASRRIGRCLRSYSHSPRIGYGTRQNE